MKRFILLFTCLVLILSVLAGCSGKNDSAQNADEKVVTVNGKIINSKVIDYYLYAEKLNNPDSSEEEMETAAIKQAARHIYVSELCDEKEIKIDENGRQTVDSQIDSVIMQYGSKDELVKEISKYGLDYDTYYGLVENAYLEGLLKTEMTKTYSDQQRLDFFNNEMVNVQHILFMLVDENQNPLEDSVVKEKKAIAEEVLSEINNGADFLEMVSEYNEDPGLTSDGYMVSRYSNFVKPFLEASMDLEVGEVSGLVETAYGYHIIKRFDHTGNTELFEDTKDEINDCLFEKQFDEWYEQSNIVVK